MITESNILNYANLQLNNCFYIRFCIFWLNPARILSLWKVKKKLILESFSFLYIFPLSSPPQYLLCFTYLFVICQFLLVYAYKIKEWIYILACNCLSTPRMTRLNYHNRWLSFLSFYCFFMNSCCKKNESTYNFRLAR